MRHVELDIDIGADAQDWAQIQAAEKLKPVETELRRMEQMVAEIVAEMEYLRTREQKLRDTNESTNERVKWFAFGTMGVLVCLGAWQIIYLRAYFRYGGTIVLFGFPPFPALDRNTTDMDPLNVQIKTSHLKYLCSVTSSFDHHRHLSSSLSRSLFLLSPPSILLSSFESPTAVFQPPLLSFFHSFFLPPFFSYKNPSILA